METTVSGKTAGALTAAVHTKLSDDVLTKIATNRQTALDKRALNALRKHIATKKQTALNKKEFLLWEQTVNKHHENKEQTGSGSSSMQTGTALQVGNAVHAALGRKNFKQKTKQTCHFGHTTTSSKVWLRNPLPSFWAGVPSGILLCYGCYQRGYRGGLPPQVVAQDDPT